MSDTQNTIDWQLPIEAVHTGGQVVSIENNGALYDFTVTPTLDGGWFRFLENGKHQNPWCPWRIRNVQPATRTTPNLGATLTAQERLEKYEGFLRGMAGENLLGANTSPYEWQAQARALVAEMEPVDPVGDAINTLDVYLAAYSKADDKDFVDRGDDLLTFGHLRVILGHVRGRELARGNVA